MRSNLSAIATIPGIRSVSTGRAPPASHVEVGKVWRPCLDLIRDLLVSTSLDAVDVKKMLSLPLSEVHPMEGLPKVRSFAMLPLPSLSFSKKVRKSSILELRLRRWSGQPLRLVAQTFETVLVVCGYLHDCTHSRLSLDSQRPRKNGSFSNRVVTLTGMR